MASASLSSKIKEKTHQMVKFKRISIYADGAEFSDMIRLSKLSYIKGLTTNPSLMKSAGIKSYEKFAKKILKKIKNKPISFEVFSDDILEMENQALKIASWGKNINIKVPITNTKGIKTKNLIHRLTRKGIVCNVTAIFTVDQIKDLMSNMNNNSHIILSVFAGRIADTGRDPEFIIKQCASFLKKFKNAKLLWASTREIFNIFQAERSGCHIITVPNDILLKLNLINKNLKLYSRETIKMFYQDALKSNFKISTN
jgi:transaldolase